MVEMLVCPQCSEPFPFVHGKKFCSRSCSQRSRYHADPEAARQRMKAWRDANPELQKEIERRHRERQPESVRKANADFRERNREHMRDRSKLLYYQTRKNTPWKGIVRSALRRALKYKLPFELTPEWADERWTGRCELTNISFRFTSFPGFYSPSIDRIIPSAGYIPSNCRFVLLAVNSFKSTGTDDDMLLVAKALIGRLQPER